MQTISTQERFLDVHLHALMSRDREQESARPGAVIAISREPGCNGEVIARTIAEALGLALYDRKIIEAIAKDAHVSERVVAALDENFRSELDDWLAGFAQDSNISVYQYMRSLRKVLFAVAANGKAVILGRGANFLLPPEKRTLGLRLVAPLEARVHNIMRERSLSEEHAREHIVKMEREQRLWVKKFGGADIKDATRYHLVINTAMVSKEVIAKIVKELIDEKACERPTIFKKKQLPRERGTFR